MDTRERIVKILVERLSVELEDADHVNYDMDLFSNDEDEGFGLDSVDVLEVVVGVKNEFDIDLRNEENLQSILKSINTLAAYIDEQK